MSHNGLLDMLTITLNINNKIVLIRGIYKSLKADIIDFSDFIYNNFNDISSKRDLFLVGDFNINILNNNNNTYLLNSIYIYIYIYIYI